MLSLKHSAAVGALLCACTIPVVARAQHEGHQMPGMSSMMTGPLGISMNRMGSGTTWVPDAVTLPSRHAMAGSWELMFHGFAFAKYVRTTGPRGDDQFSAPNWGMVMATRSLAGGRLQGRAMLSLDPAT